MTRFIILSWFLVVYPSNSNRVHELPDAYATEAECMNDPGPPPSSRIEAAVRDYVAANGGDVARTRAACIEKK